MSRSVRATLLACLTLATGTVAMGGEPKPVSVDLGGDLFAEQS